MAREYYSIRNIRVIDGDTIECDIDLGFNVILNDQKVRLMGYDSWEISKRRKTVTVTDEEIRKGEIAKQTLIDLINKYHDPRIIYYGKDNYGRWLLYLRLNNNTIRLEQWMMEHGHTRSK